jgi:hypothetical protein
MSCISNIPQKMDGTEHNMHLLNQLLPNSQTTDGDVEKTGGIGGFVYKIILGYGLDDCGARV